MLRRDALFHREIYHNTLYTGQHTRPALAKSRVHGGTDGGTPLALGILAVRRGRQISKRRENRRCTGRGVVRFPTALGGGHHLRGPSGRFGQSWTHSRFPDSGGSSPRKRGSEESKAEPVSCCSFRPPSKETIITVGITVRHGAVEGLDPAGV